jgi:hypothetical protein
MPKADPLESLRRICLALPEVIERLSHGEPTWFVRGKKTFVMYADHHHDDRLAFWCAASPGAQLAESGTIRIADLEIPIYRYVKPGEPSGNLARRAGWFQKRVR